MEVARLADPVLAIDSTAETLQLLRYAVDLVFAHLGNLVKAVDAQLIQGPLDRGSDPFDQLQVVPVLGVRLGCRIRGAIAGERGGAIIVRVGILVGSVLVLGALLLFLSGMVSRYFSLGLGGG